MPSCCLPRDPATITPGLADEVSFFFPGEQALRAQEVPHGGIPPVTPRTTDVPRLVQRLPHLAPPRRRKRAVRVLVVGEESQHQEDGHVLRRHDLPTAGLELFF